MVSKLLPGRALRLLAGLFPPVAESDLQAVLSVLPVDAVQSLAAKGQDARVITWRGVDLVLPYRVYFPEPVPEQVLGLTTESASVARRVSDTM